MATSKITLDEGVTTHTATNTIAEDALTKHIPRSVVNNSSGTEIFTVAAPGKVDIQSALPAGTNAIGKLAANSGVDIGDVDVTSVTGNVTVIQGLGTNLHTVVDSGVITSLTNALPAGNNNIGDVDVASIAAGSNNIGDVDIASLPAGNLGMQLMVASLSVTPASNITDATYIGDIKFGESLPAGTNAIGKLAANSGVDIGDVDVASVTGNVTVVQATGTNLHAVIDSGTFTGTITGSVTANAGTNLNTSLLALETGGNLAGAATSLAIIDDWDETDRCKVNPIVGQAGVAAGSGIDSVTTQRVVLATDVSLPAGTNAIGKLAANSGVDIGDVDITSIAAGNNNIGDVDIVTVPADPFGLNADVGSSSGSISAKLRFIAATGIPVTSIPAITGSITANAGTDLNTSLLALEAGGNLAAAATSLAIIDDWDETDRAKVNPIVGQAGVQGGSGTVSALTQRVVLATDVALPSGTNAIGKLAANSGVDIGDVDVTSLPAIPAGTNLIGRIAASLETSTIYNATTALTPKWAFANVAASQTDSSIITTPGAKKLRVLSAAMVAGATATNLTFNSKPAGAGTAISMLFANGANGGAILPFNPVGWFETVVSEGLTVTTGAGSTTGIQVCYVEV